jgi:hypothetical protein
LCSQRDKNECADKDHAGPWAQPTGHVTCPDQPKISIAPASKELLEIHIIAEFTSLIIPLGHGQAQDIAKESDLSLRHSFISGA